MIWVLKNEFFEGNEQRILNSSLSLFSSKCMETQGALALS